MMKSLKQSLILFGTLLSPLLLAQCANPTDMASTQMEQQSQSLVCTTASCVPPDEKLVGIDSSPNTVNVTAQLAEFDLAGECNEGGFSSNEVRWDLRYNSSVVRSSRQIFPVGKFRCVNGRYSLLVKLGPINGVDGNCNRTGLSVCGTASRATYYLDLYIIAKDETGAERTGPNFKKTVTLTPL